MIPILVGIDGSMADIIVQKAKVSTEIVFLLILEYNGRGREEELEGRVFGYIDNSKVKQALFSILAKKVPG
jgi:hypothetical protein